MGKTDIAVEMERRWDKTYLVLCSLLLPLVVFFSFCRPWEIGADFWEVAATVREISVNPFHPSNPILKLEGDTALRFIPYTLFWGLFRKWTHLGIFTTMGIAGLMNYVLFIVGLYLFVSRRFKSPSLPAYTLIVMLLVWGTGYGWSNAYHLEMFLLNLSYVSFFTFGLSLNALYALSCYYDMGKRRYLATYTVLSVISFLTHPHTGLFCFVAALAIALEFGDYRRVILLQVIPLSALSISLIWPYFSYWDVFTKGIGTDWLHTPLFSNQIGALGMSLAGIPIALYYGVKGRYPFLVIGSGLCLLIYLISYLFEIKIGGRFIFFTVFFLHLSIALYLKENKGLRMTAFKGFFRFHHLVILLLFIPSGVNRVEEMGVHVRRVFDNPFKLHAYESPINPYLFLSGYLTRSDVVLANPLESWVIPAITGARIVALQKSNPLIMDEWDRRIREVVHFFCSPISLEERLGLMEKYRVTHILINLAHEVYWDRSFKDDLKKVGKEVAREKGQVLYRVIKGHEGGRIS